MMRSLYYFFASCSIIKFHLSKFSTLAFSHVTIRVYLLSFLAYQGIHFLLFSHIQMLKNSISYLLGQTFSTVSLLSDAWNQQFIPHWADVFNYFLAFRCLKPAVHPSSGGRFHSFCYFQMLRTSSSSLFRRTFSFILLLSDAWNQQFIPLLADVFNYFLTFRCLKPAVHPSSGGRFQLFQYFQMLETSSSSLSERTLSFISLLSDVQN